MNFKLLTFIFVVIGVQLINSSIINKQSIHELVLTSNSDGEIINFDIFDTPWAKVKYLTFNSSETVEYVGEIFPKLECLDQLKPVNNDFCSRDNGKYQAKFIECKNLKYPNGASFNCKLFNAKVLNKNVQFKQRYRILVPIDTPLEKFQTDCRIQYAFEDSTSYNEADDVENKDKILM